MSKKRAPNNTGKSSPNCQVVLVTLLEEEEVIILLKNN